MYMIYLHCFFFKKMIIYDDSETLNLDLYFLLKKLARTKLSFRAGYQCKNKCNADLAVLLTL